MIFFVYSSLLEGWWCRTQYAGLAQASDGLSVVPAGEDGGGARAGDALSVRCWIFDRVKEGWADLVVGSWVCGATPAQEIKPQLFQAIKLFSFYIKCWVARLKLLPVDLHRCDIAVMFED